MLSPTENRFIVLKRLVITIIVMLILAGVSLNAIIGDNGLVMQTQYASFLQEMTSVQEAVDTWKTGKTIDNAGELTNKIPVTRMVTQAELTRSSRLTGEVGYYRVWSLTGKRPKQSVSLSVSEFDNEFSGEIIAYPAGIQDLYVLNNEILDLDEDKVYYIDAVNSMIYSVNGFAISGVSAHSLNMLNAIMNGSEKKPKFASAEVSGGGSTGSQILAGNTGTEYIDEDGNSIYKKTDGTFVDINGNSIEASKVQENENYNPNGFQIIASPTSSNIFKLYNNGDLYGKGIKGVQLNTSQEEMAKINPYVWKEWKVPSEVGAYKKIIVGNGGAIYFIDSRDNLWVFGSNSSNNKFGLTQEQSVEYTGREAFKVELGDKKVSRVFAGSNSTFIITTDNKLLAAGANNYGQLGLGHTNSIVTFTEVNVPNVQNIDYIYCTDTHGYMTLLRYKDNTFYVSGKDNWEAFSGRTIYTTFTQVLNGTIGPDIDSDIKDIIINCQTFILKKDGTIWVAGYIGYMADNLTSDKQGNFSRHALTGVEEMYFMHSGTTLLKVKNGTKYELYCIPANTNNYGTDYYNKYSPVKMELPASLVSEEIKECYTVNGAVYILSKTGVLYGTGSKAWLGIDDSNGYTDKIQKLNQTNVTTMYNSILDIGREGSRSVVFLEKNNKFYITGDSTLMFGNDILQKSWTLVASNVKEVGKFGTTYIDRDNNLWVAGDSRTLGLGNDSNEYKAISNYIIHPDTSIRGKVKKVYSPSGLTYILTTENKLLVTGLYSLNGSCFYPGWSDDKNKTGFVEIASNVELFSCDSSNIMRIIIKNDGSALAWGINYSGATGMQTEYVLRPTSFTLPTTIGKVVKINSYGWQRSYIVNDQGKVFLTGKWTNGSYDGGHTATNYFSQYTYNLTLVEGENIVDMVPMNDANALFFTNKGRVFGYGAKKYLGIGSTLADLRENGEITGINNVSQLVSGNGWYVAVTNDGKVYGTGSNLYGILGRWVGIDRNSPNSRYKTAFDWVECPELEI